MEHRWGDRLDIHYPVRIGTTRRSLRHGALINVSNSGAFIGAAVPLPAAVRVYVELKLRRAPRARVLLIEAYVTRSTPEGVGLEWCDFAPQGLSEFLRAMGRGHEARPHVSLCEQHAQRWRARDASH